MDNPDRIALAAVALGTLQAIALLIFISSGGGSSLLADDQTRAVIQTSYAPAGGDP